MKRLIFTILLISTTFGAFAQCADSTTLFFENFDGTTHKLRSTSVLNQPNTDWFLIDTLYTSPTRSYHSPVYAQQATMSQAYIDTVRFSPGRNIVYLSFKHICKIHALDEAYIYYRYSIGGNATTGYTYSNWTAMPFTPTSSYYYGDATGTSIVGGKFTQNTYPEWQGSNNNAMPNNSWWKNELIDISQFISGGDGQVFEIKFTVRKMSVATLYTGWFLDDIKLLASNKELIPPKISLTAPLVINNVSNSGPFTIKATVTDRPNNSTLRDSVKLYYNENGGPYIQATTNILPSNQYSWTLPTQCNGNVVRYYITAKDSACNPAVRLDSVFTVVLSTTGTTTNGARTVGIHNIPFSLEVGVPEPVSVIIRNRANNPMTSATITLSVNNVPQPVYNWTSVTDFHPIRPFCLNFEDTVSIGSFMPVLGWDTVRVCITQRNGTPNNYPVDSTCVQYIKYGCSAILSGDLTIGGTGANFANINSFFTTLQNCGMNGPIVAKLAPGTYNSSDFYFNAQINGQSAVNTITFESATGNPADVIILDNGTNASRGAVTFDGAKNINLNKLTLQGKTGSTWSRGVYFTGSACTNIKVTNCIINVDNALTTSNQFAGISRTAASTAVSGDTVEFRNNIINGGVYGIHYLGTSARQNSIIAIDSIITNSSYMGIYTIYSNVGTINKNQTTQSPASVQTYTGIHIERSTTTSSISKNKIFADVNTNVGLNINNVSNGSAGDVLVSNNEIRGKATVVNTYGIQNTASTRMVYLHNTIRIYSLVNLAVTACYYHTSGVSVTFMNNILVNDCLSLTNQNYPIYYVVNPTTLVSDFNVYHSEGPIGYYTVVRNTLSEWQFALGNTKDTSTITLAPPFLNPAQSLKLSNYAGFECPKNPLVYDDVIDSLRACEVTHRGCYSTYVPPKDLALVGLISPVLGTCPQTTYPITLKVFNYGCTTVNFANTPASIRTIATGGLVLNTNYTINTGTLAPNQFMNLTINPGVAIPYNSNVNFTFIMSYAGDERAFNDTMTMPFRLEVIAPAIAVYDETFSNGTQLNWKIQQIAGAGNWSFQEGISANPTLSPVYGTGRLFFNSKTFSNTTISRITMPVMDLTNSVNPILEIWYAHDNAFTNSTYNQEGILVKISTNGGTTWTPLIPEFPNAINTTDTILKRGQATITGYTLPAWVKYTYDLSSYATNGCVFIAIDAKSKLGNNINIDRVRVRKIYNNDCAVENIYTTQLRPTDVQTTPEIKAIITNEGRNVQNNVNVTLTITGANSYTETDTISTIPYNGRAFATFNGTYLANVGANNIQITVQSDDLTSNNTKNALLATSTDGLAYADSSSYLINFGSSTPIMATAKYKVVDTIVVTAVNFYPTNLLELNGKRIRAFVSNAAGTVITTSDTITMTPGMLNTWVSIPLNNLALTSTSTDFYAGIEMIDAGYYLTAQYESPTRSDAFFYLDPVSGTYTEQSTGRFMIGANVAPKIDRELAILSIINPISNCDLVVEPITIKIANNGPKHIMPGTVFHYTVNNGPVVTQTLNDTIFSNQIRTFTFSTPYDFTNHQINLDDNYSLKIWANPISSDIIRFNDTIRSIVVSKGKSFAPIVVDTIDVSYSTPGTLVAQLPAQINPGIIQWFTKVGNQYVGPLYQGPGPYITPNLIYYDTLYYVSVAPGVLYTPQVGNVTTANNQSPFTFSAGYSRGRILYKQSEIGNYGVIAKIAINVNSIANGILGIPIKIYIKQTDLDTLKATDPFDWDNEIADATIVLDAQNYFNTTGWIELPISDPLNYTSGNILIYTESNCGGTNCNAVSGGGTYPTFKIATSANKVQSKTANTNPIFTGTWGTPTSNRWVMKFYVADMTCASERIPVQLHVPNKPTYDVETMAFTYPVTMPQANQNCALYSENIQVVYKNLLDKSIPANKVMAKAGFRDGTSGAYTWITHLITDSFAPLEEKLVTFNQTYDFSAPTASRTIQFVATSDLINESIVFRMNDTITGSIASTRTVTIPDQLTYFGNFTQTFNVAPGVSQVTQYYFYDSYQSVTPISGGNGVPSYTTTNLYDTAMYYMTAKTPGAAPNCITKRIPITINVAVPTNNHDLKTNSLVYPTSYTCGLMTPTLVVNYNNTDSCSIPSNTFKVTAKFTGTSNVTVVDTIIVPFAPVQRLPLPPSTPQPTFNIPFTKTAALGSTLQNRIYNYEIFTDAVSSSYMPYRLNDTIRGELKIPANPVAPANLSYSVPYGQPYTISPLTHTLNSGTPLNKVTFYNSTGITPLYSGISYTTPDIYGPTTYKYGGRIISIGFEEEAAIGSTSTLNGSFPFVFTATESQGVVMYTKEEMGGYVGFIDTLSIYIQSNVVGTFPIQIYLKNSDSITLPGGNYDWANYFVNGAKLIYNGTPTFTSGWFKIPIPGGFYYTGNSLLMLTSHNCYGQANLAALNITPSPTFRYATTTINRVLHRQGVYTSGSVAFSTSNQRISARFSINYTCESPLANITLNPTIPSVDLHVTEIVTPITPNNTYPANQIVSTTIVNHGTSNASGFTVGYQLGNNPPVEQAFSGAIAAGASSNFIFTTPVDLSNIYFSTPFMVYVRHNLDLFKTNDTLKLQLKKDDPCAPIAVVGSRDTVGAHISKFTFAGIDNGPGTPIFSCPVSVSGNGKYSDFTETVTPGFVVRGQSFPITIVNSFTANSGATLWKYVYLDMNRNNVFEASELIFSKPSVPSPTLANQLNATTTGFTLPVDINAQTGLTRLRVITASQNLTGNIPCSAFINGETEDYAINIADPYPIDPGSTYIIHPSGDVCLDSKAKIKVAIKNFGSSNLVLTPTEPLTVNATVTGPVNSTYSIQVTSGTVAQWDTMIAVIHNVDLSQVGSYNIAVNIQYASDQFVINNIANTTCQVNSNDVTNLPISISFDAQTEYIAGADVAFPSFWKPTTTHTTFKWDIDSLGTTNAPLAGPSFDHSLYATGIQNLGQYAVVSAPQNSSTAAIATLSTGCIDLHYKDGYPCEMSYWQHIFGTATATSKFYVEIGSGEYFIRMDSIIGRTHNDINMQFLKRAFVMNQIDENSRIRFIVTGRTGKIDPAIDDLNIKHGTSDLAVMGFDYPVDFTVSTDDCVVKGDTIRPRVILKNVGRVPILTFTINFNAGIGTIIQYVPDETWNGVLNPGETMIYQFNQGVIVPQLFSYLQFQANATTLSDEFLNNNKNTIVSCTTVGIEDNLTIQNGVALGQNIPNPAISETMIPFYTTIPGKTELRVHSAEGQLLYQTSINAEYGDNNIMVNTSNWASGIYLYTIYINNTQLTRKMLIQK